ncbi:MAG: PilW family protein [Sedimenticola sp.]|nr:PilW family protein [Sedimenticola sp.]
MMATLLRTKATGFGLVELMIAMVIGLFLIGGVIQIYATSSADRRVTEGLSRMQENGRFANEFLSRDIRMAGFTNCYQARTANSINIVTGSNAYAHDFSMMVNGYEGGVSTFPSAIAALAGTDAIVVKRGDDSDDYFVDNHNPTSATIHLVQNHDLKKGEILMIADCNKGQVGIFQQSNVNNNNVVSVVVHNTGGSTTPGNCTKKLWGSGTCPAAGTTITTGTYGPESRIMRMVSNAYYIANNAAGVPSLYRKGLTDAGVISSAQELVEGVENMQIEYGVDTDATADGVANQYLKANAVTTAQWQDGRVASVRLKLLLRSIEQSAAKPQQYSYDGQVYDGGTNPLPTDRYLRREFTTTVKLRNLGL